MQSSCSYIDYTTVQSREVGFFHSEISLFNLFEEVKFLVLLLTLCFLIGVHIKKRWDECLLWDEYFSKYVGNLFFLQCSHRSAVICIYRQNCIFIWQDSQVDMAERRAADQMFTIVVIILYEIIFFAICRDYISMKSSS